MNNAKISAETTTAPISSMIEKEELKWRQQIESSVALGLYDCPVTISNDLRKDAVDALVNKFTLEGYQVQVPNFRTAQISWKHFKETEMKITDPRSSLQRLEDLKLEVDYAFVNIKQAMAEDKKSWSDNRPPSSPDMIAAYTAISKCGVTVQVRSESVYYTWPMCNSTDPNWEWKMEWCRQNCVSPADFWQQAQVAFDNVLLFRKAAAKAKLKVIKDNGRGLLIDGGHSSYTWNSLESGDDTQFLMATLGLSVL